jgi:hypothetical protein
MRHLSMFWYTERGHLVCRWTQLRDSETYQPFSIGDWLRLLLRPGSQSTEALGER